MSRTHYPIALSGRFVLLAGCAVAGLAGLLAALMLLERVGLPDYLVAMTLLGLVLITYAGFGIVGRTMNLSEFAEAGRRMPPDLIGMAAAADWLPGAALVVFLGGLVLDDASAMAWLAGWASGLLVMLALVATPMRRYGSASVPAFLAKRFGGHPARLVGLVILLASSFLILVAEVHVIEQVGQQFFGLRADRAIWLAIAALAVCAGLGGMRAVVQANALNYILILLAMAAPAALFSFNLTGTTIPYATFGDALSAIGFGDATRSALSTPSFDTIALMLVVIAGTATLPHMLGRYLPATSVGGTRQAVTWSLIFLVALVITIPVFAALALWQTAQALVGADARFLPDWVFQYGSLDLIRICGVDATSAAVVRAACQASGTGFVIDATQIAIDPTIAAIVAPRAAGFPLVIGGLVAVGILSAAMATANGLLLAIANAVGGDLYRDLFGQRASAGRHLMVARVALIGAAALAVWIVDKLAVSPLSLLAWGFNLAAAGLFPAVVLGLWWQRTRRFAGLLGMAAGLGVTLYYIVATEFDGLPGWRFLGLTDIVANHAAAIFGLPVGFLVIVVASLASERPFFRVREKEPPPAPEAIG